MKKPAEGECTEEICGGHVHPHGVGPFISPLVVLYLELLEAPGKTYLINTTI